MYYQKGQSGNPEGRPKGASNKISSKQREFLSDYLLKSKSKFKKHMSLLKDRDYVHAYLMLMHYVVPKPAVVELREVPQLAAFIAMTPEERKAVIDEIQEYQKNENQ